MNWGQLWKIWVSGSYGGKHIWFKHHFQEEEKHHFWAESEFCGKHQTFSHLAQIVTCYMINTMQWSQSDFRLWNIVKIEIKSGISAPQLNLSAWGNILSYIPSLLTTFNINHTSVGWQYVQNATVFAYSCLGYTAVTLAVTVKALPPVMKKLAFNVPFRCPAIRKLNAKQQNFCEHRQLGVSKPMAWEEPEGDPHTALNSHNP